MPESKLLVIDGFSLAFRAYYSMPTSLTLPDGSPINVVLGFSNLLFQSIDKFKPDHICVCFDRPEPTFRHKNYPEYKAHRPPPPDDFKVQIPVLKETIAAYGIPILEAPGFEADDIMGTLAKLADKSKQQCFLITGDHDALQLVSDYTRVVMTKKGLSELIIYTPDVVQEKFGFAPPQIIDFKALKGDSSDNIPGVAGVGDKTATNLLTQFRTLDNIYANLDDISSAKVKEKLERDKEKAFISYDLATINCDVPIDEDLSKLLFDPNWPSIINTFKSMQFTRLVSKYLDKLEGQEMVEETGLRKPDGQYECVDDVKGVNALLSELKQGFAIDLETTSLDFVATQIVGVSLAYKDAHAVYIPMNQYLQEDSADTSAIPMFADMSAPHILQHKSNPLLAVLKPILEDPAIPKYTHNGKYEVEVLNLYGIQLSGITFDSLLAAYLLYPGERLGLKALTLQCLNIQMTTYEDVAGKGKSQIPFQAVPLEAATAYAAADADFTRRLKRHLDPKLDEKNLRQLLVDMELPLMLVLAKVEQHGVCLDTRYLGELSQTFTKRLTTLAQDIQSDAGTSFNIKSTKQLAEVLYDKLGLTVHKKTKTGRSTDSSVLDKLRDEHPIAEKLLAYRMLEKLMNTYVSILPTLIHAKTGRIHTSFNQTVAITGRLSSVNPNLQNIPIRTEEGHKIRRAFVPAKGHRILSADYSQIELRLLAHLAKDENMVAAFNEGKDIHRSTAAVIHHVDLDAVSKTQRRDAKAVNFGIIYGQSAYGLSETLGISRKDAQAIIDSYFAKFPKIRSFIDNTIEKAREDGFVRTEFGRIRPLPEIRDKNWNRRQFAERTAVNTRLQGTAADIMKLAMIRVQNRLEKEAYKSRMIIQVHDELVFEVAAGEEDRLLAMVKEEMQGTVSYSVPLSVDAVIGDNWQEIS